MASLFSEGYQTKTEVVCAIAKDVANPLNQSQLEEKTKQWKTREDVHEPGIIYFGNGASFLSQGGVAKTKSENRSGQHMKEYTLCATAENI